MRPQNRLTFPRSAAPGRVVAVGRRRWRPRPAAPRTRCCSLLIIAVAGYVVAARRSDAPWARVVRRVPASWSLVVIVVRIAVRRCCSVRRCPGPDVLFTLPEVPLPDWAAGVRLGGEVTARGGAAPRSTTGCSWPRCSCCVGAANALASARAAAALRARRALRGRRRRRRRADLRPAAGQPTSAGSAPRAGCAAATTGACAALARLGDAGARGRAGALGRAGRGDGRPRLRAYGGRPAARRDGSPRVLVLGGLLGVCVGIYGLLDGDRPALARAADAARRPRRWPRAGLRARRPPRPAAPATGPTRGRCPEWLVVGSRRGRGGRRCSSTCAGTRRDCSWPASTAAAGAAAGLRRHPGRRAARVRWRRRCRGRRAAGPRRRPPRRPRGGGGVIRASRQVGVTYAGARRAGAVRRRPDVPEGELCWSSAAPARASRRCCARVNGLVPHFTGGTAARPGHRRRPRHPRPTRRATWPTSSASSARTRWPASSPTPSRTSSPTAWSRSALAARRDAPAGRGDARPARPRRAARPPAGHAVRRPAAAGRDRRRCSPPHPRVLVLDEPTSALDPAAAEEVLAALQRLVHDLGTHRAAGRAPARAGRAVRRPGRARARRRPAGRVGEPGRRCCATPRSPRPVVELGRLAGWSPLPLSVRDARRRGRRRCASRLAAASTPPAPAAPRTASAGAPRRASAWSRALRPRCRRCAASTSRLRRRRGRRADGPQRRRQVDAAGRPWSGCTRPTAGTVAVDGAGPGRRCAPAALRAARRAGAAGARPTCSTPTRSARECARRRPRRRGAAPGTTPRAARPARPRRRRRPRTRATCPRASGSPWPWPSCWPRARRCCCSTSRPAAWTTRAKRRLVEILRDLAADGPRGRAGHPRRRARRRGRRPGGGAGRRRGRRRRADRRGGGLLPGVRPAGRQGPRARSRWLTVDRGRARAREPDAVSPMTAGRGRAPPRSPSGAAAHRRSRWPSTVAVGVVAFGWPLLADAAARRWPAHAADAPLAVRAAAAAAARRRAGRARRRRHRRQGGRHARRARRGRRRAAAARRRAPPGSSRCSSGDLSAAGCSAAASASCSGAVTLFASALLTGGVGPVAAVPDARGRLGRLLRRLPAAGARAAPRSLLLAAYGAGRRAGSTAW